MRLGHATVRYNAKMSIGNTKQQSTQQQNFSRPPTSRHACRAKSDMCEKNRKIEIYLFTPAGQLSMDL